MGRHSLPDEYGQDTARSTRPAVRARTVAVATALVLAVAAGTTYAVQSGLIGSGACGDGTARLDVAASPDVAPALRAAADEARRTDIRSDGNCLDIRVSARDSARVADSLGPGKDRGSPDFQIWVPDAKLWLERARAAGSVTLSSLGRVAVSPVGVAAVPTAAAKLGWPRRTYSWAELAAAGTTRAAMRLGTADPSRSATGLLALTSVGQSAAATKDPDAQTKSAAVAKLLAQRMADSDTQVLGTLPQNDSASESGNPKRNQAVFLSEQAAFAHRAAKGSPDLRLFYPKDGTALLDYPFTMVDEGRLSIDQARAAMRFQLYLEDPAGRRVMARYGFRAPGKPVDEALARAAGANAPQPYSETAESPPPTKAVEETLGMWTITVQSARLTTVVDTSGSMANVVEGSGGRTRMDITKNSLITALSQFTDEDELGLWEFATNLDGPRDYRKLVPTSRLGGPAPGGGTHRARLSTAFGTLRPDPNGATGLYDTTLAAYKDAQASYARGKFNAVVILTDGSNQDTVSLSRSALIAELKILADPRRPIPLIAIAVGPDADRTEVQEIAEVTGGGGYQVNDPSEVPATILKAITNSAQSS
ncbi:substrate-binding and VWA domain-containing protein [Streptomyces sp. NPDC004111]|uniref:substrate-binding and VWA domain-containing protein n=1 Tax=Streptomyces sp. NPDC004111 TaxID=3364690 RepID=UPI0036CCC6B1